MKNTIRLTESELKGIISETIKNILEVEMPILHGEGNGEVYRDDAFVTDWRDNPNDEPNKVKAPYNSYVWNDKFSKHYPTPESFWNPKDTRAYKYTKDLDKIHREEDKFKKSEDLKTQKALDAADTRPLHRKGSLNRAMDENVIRKVVSESIKKVLKEGFMDNLKTNVAYVKNKVKDNLPPLGSNTTDSVIDGCKRHIKYMEENLQNNQKCGSRFLHSYNVYMEAAKEYGYVKYYKKMKELYNQMVEESLYDNEHDINGPSFKEIYNDLDNRVKSRGGHFHG